jgi:adenylate cyclase
MSRPIHQLVDVSKAIASGNYEFRFTQQRKDELGELMQAMNEMSEELLEKERVEQTFSRYVAPKVAEELLKNSDLSDLGGRYVNASVLFADIVGFTSISENMPPDKVSELLNEYFGYIAEIVHMYQGHIDKYIGDCVMAVFGAPEADVNHAQHAVECAVLIQNMVAVLNEKRREKNLIELMFHIGINSGGMVAGNIGSAERMDYTVMGRAVNIASRLSGTATPGTVLISDATYEAIRKDGHIHCQPSGVITLRGSTQPLATYVVVNIVGQRGHLVKSRLYKILKYPEEV